MHCCFPPLSRSWLEEASTDFRVGAAALNKLQFAAWGCGNSLYAANFNAVARRVERQLLDLGARKFTALGGPFVHVHAPACVDIDEHERHCMCACPHPGS